MINKEFIPYEEALALKELGFDEPCFAFYLAGGVRYKEYKDSQNKNSAFYNDTVCSIPTYSQAFRWFREKHTLYHDIKMFGDWDKPQFSYIISGRTITNPAHMWHYESKDSYEEVELECLKKLIEIVKNK